MNLEKLVPENYGQLENDDLALSEGRIARLVRENMDDEQTLDGDVPHVINCVLSGLLDDIIDEMMSEAEMMAKVKEAHARSALRDLEITKEYEQRTDLLVEQLERISEEMEKTAEKIDN